VTCVANFDNKLNMLPDSIVNFCTRKFAYGLFEKLFEKGSF